MVLNKVFFEKYVPLIEIRKMTDKKIEYYESEFGYFDGEVEHHAKLFIDVDYDYVYGQLERLGLMFGVGLFFL